MVTVNYFKELSLNHEASADDVRTAYKKLAKQWHPDKNQSDPGAEDKFKKVLEAYNHLKSDDRRELHAAEVQRAEAVEKAAAKKSPTKTSTNSADLKTEQKPTHNEAKSAQQTHTHNPQRKARPKTGNGGKDRRDGRPKSTRSGERSYSRHSSPMFDTFTRAFMGSGFGSFADPFDEIIFDIFMISPEKSPPKTKSFTDPFGNKLPKNIDEDIYDWKAATKPTSSQPDYQEYANHETEFACHYCGMMMGIDILRKHEPKCLRFGGRRQKADYDFADADVNEAYRSHDRGTGSPTTAASNRKIKCCWCGLPVSKADAAEHIAKCKEANLSRSQRKANQSRPEWNNNFTETEYKDLPPNLISGRKTRPKASSPFISVDDFAPFTNPKPAANGGRTCWNCKLNYGAHAVHVCRHIH